MNNDTAIERHHYLHLQQILMSGFCDDEQLWNRHFRDSKIRPENDPSLKIFEWYHDKNAQPEEFSLQSAELIARDSVDGCALRIVSAPLDTMFLPELSNLKPVFEHYRFPSAILSELLASVTHSFGVANGDSGDPVSLAWCHFLCKDVQVRFHGAEDEVNLDDNHRLGTRQDWNWKVCHFVIHTRKTK